MENKDTPEVNDLDNVPDWARPHIAILKALPLGATMSVAGNTYYNPPPLVSSGYSYSGD